MKIFSITPQLFYTAKFDTEELDVYNLTFDNLTLHAYCLDFFERYKYDISKKLQNDIGINPLEMEKWANIVVIQAMELEALMEDMMDRAEAGESVDFHDIFEEYEGNELRKYPAFKCYGLKKGISSLPYPSLIRIYALEVGKAMVMVYGGIKINNPISKCPVLKNNVNQKIAAVASFLASRQVESENDLDRLAE